MAYKDGILNDVNAQALFTADEELRAATAMRDNAAAQLSMYNTQIAALTTRKAAILTAAKTALSAKPTDEIVLVDKVTGAVKYGVADVVEEPVGEIEKP